MIAAVDRFVSILEQGPADCSCVFNPWRDHDERDAAPRKRAPATRRANMAAYVEARRGHARVMLLGEAPSHRGCRFTGIAFCSETELVHKRDLVAGRELALTSRDAAIKPQRERSAAVIWGEIERAGHPFEVVLWNAFPWHPHGVEATTTNRKPRLTEVQQGHAAFEALMGCFTHKLCVLAVGKVAEDALARWGGLECGGYIRHPAQGGEAKFRAQFREQAAALI